MTVKNPSIIVYLITVMLSDTNYSDIIKKLHEKTTPNNKPYKTPCC